MKSVLISIQPKWCELIASGKKTVEVRKTKPKLEVPFKVYIYCTQEKRLLRKFDKGERIDDEHFFEEHVFVRQNTWIRGHFNPNGKVIGEFVCEEIFPIRVFENGSIQNYICHSMERSCVPYDDISNYIGKGKTGYGWHISNLVIYDKPKGLGEFYQKCKSYDKDDWENDDCLECENPCGNGGKLYLKRPPQSWCYVEGGVGEC